jgi:hypothetical protein
VEVILTLENGTTIETGVGCAGNLYRVCCSTGSICRYADSYHIAMSYATQFEEYCPTNAAKAD